MIQPTTWPEFRRDVVEPAIARQEYLSLVLRTVDDWDELSVNAVRSARDGLSMAAARQLRDDLYAWWWGLHRQFELTFLRGPTGPELSKVFDMPCGQFLALEWAVLGLGAVEVVPLESGPPLATWFDEWWGAFLTEVDSYMGAPHDDA